MKQDSKMRKKYEMNILLFNHSRVFKSMKINRRNFLKTTALTSLYFAGFGVPSLANSGPKNLVVVMLRGGMDGLCAIPIKGDKNFEKLRSKINLDKL